MKRSVKSFANKTGSNICVYGHQSIIRILNDPRDWTRTDSVGRLFHNLITKLLGIYTPVWHKISVAMSSCLRCADRLKNSACWYLNKMINDSVHEDHLFIFSTSLDTFQAYMPWSIHCLFICYLLVWFHKHVEFFYQSKFSASLSKIWSIMTTNDKLCCCFSSHNDFPPSGSAVRINICTRPAPKSVLFR